jgi:hypothetical protein
MRTVENYRTTKTILKKLYIRQVSLAKCSEDLAQILEHNPRLIIALNHGPMLGALAGLVGLVDSFSSANGNQRAPFGITWRKFYELPVTKQVLSFLTQIDHGVGFDEACQLLQTKGFSDCVIMPEGELCNFGDGVEVLPFLSPRFIELAIVNRCPVLIGVHQGSEKWAWPIKLDSRLSPLFRWLPAHMKESIEHSRTVSVPKLFKQKIDCLYMSFSLYQPSHSLETLSNKPEERDRQLKEEAEIVREKMKQMMAKMITERQLNALLP